MKFLLRPVLFLVARAPAVLDGTGWPRFARRWWLAARFASLSMFPSDFTVVIQPEGVTFRGNTRDVIQRSICVYGVWEPDISEWMRRFVMPGSTVVDVGANTGYYTMLLAERVGETGCVVAVEPVPSIHAELRANVEANRRDRVELVHCALGAAPGEVEVFRASAANTGNSGTQWEEGHTSEGMVDVRTADSLLADRAESIQLVKIDTEGDEGAVLDGMRRTIEAMPSGSAVLVEVTPEKLTMRDDSGSHIWSFFMTRGWVAHRIRNDYAFTAYAGRQTAELTRISELPTNRSDLVFRKP